MSKYLVAYSSLVALKDNLPDKNKIEEIYVNQFHAALKIISESIDNLSIFDPKDFSIPSKHIMPVVNSIKNGSVHHSTVRFSDRSLLMMKIDSALNYIKMISTGNEKQQIMGFHQ